MPISAIFDLLQLRIPLVNLKTTIGVGLIEQLEKQVEQQQQQEQQQQNDEEDDLFPDNPPPASATAGSTPPAPELNQTSREPSHDAERELSNGVDISEDEQQEEEEEEEDESDDVCNNHSLRRLFLNLYLTRKLKLL